MHGGVAFAALTGGANVVVTVPAERAQAYPQDPNNCNDDHISFSFWDTDAVWSSSDRSAAKNALFYLPTAKDHDGDSLVTVEDRGNNSYLETPVDYPEVFIEVKDRPGNSTNGSSECVLGASIWINKSPVVFEIQDPNLRPTRAQFFSRVAAHEMMHLMGAEHGGAFDDISGVLPIMATCWADRVSPRLWRSDSDLRSDDEAYLTWLHSDLPNRQLNANVGFESGDEYWLPANGGTKTYKATGGVGNGSRINWSSPSSTSTAYLYQTVRVLTGDDNEQYRPTAQARIEPGYKGWGRVEMYTRSITLDDGSTNSCVYPDNLNTGQNPNRPYTFGALTLRQTHLDTDLTTTYETLQPSTWWNPPTTDGFEFTVRFAGYASDSNGVGSIRIDNLRIDGT